MRLIYAYAGKYRNFEDQGFTLTNSYKVLPLREGGAFTGLRITGVDNAFRQDMPENILSVSALVGRNATGKTNFVEMVGAKRGRSGFGGEGQPDAYFLLYASDQSERGLYFFEVVSPGSFGKLFSWMGEAADAPCAAGWCRYDSGAERLLPLEPEEQPPEEKCVMISLCDRLGDYGMAAGHALPLERRSGKYLANKFESQVHVVQKLYRSGDLTVLRDPQYRLELMCDMRYLERGPEGTPSEDTPLFPTLYDKAELSERQRRAIRLAEGWIKFIAGSQTEGDFDSWHSLQYLIARRTGNLPAGPDCDENSRIIRQLLVHRLSDVLEFLQSGILPADSREVGQTLLEEFLHPLLTSPALDLTDSSIIIPVASADGGVENEACGLTRALVDGIAEQSAGLAGFIRPVWEDVSDGELWYIHFFAAVSEVLESAAQAGHPDTCILILDEPEIHMHPDLARRMLDHLTRWLGDVCVDMKIQIILTTHSPFILSDVEMGNVQILRRTRTDAEASAAADTAANAEAERLASVAPPKKQTYAANIYTLLTDSFFLESGFGELARKQIRGVFEELESGGDIDSARETYLNCVIRNIGERLIRDQLDERFRARFGARAEGASKEASG